MIIWPLWNMHSIPFANKRKAIRRLCFITRMASEHVMQYTNNSAAPDQIRLGNTTGISIYLMGHDGTAYQERQSASSICNFVARWHENAFQSTGPVSGESPSHWLIPLTNARQWGLRWLRCSNQKETFKQTVELSVIWDAKTLVWPRSDNYWIGILMFVRLRHL